MDKREFKKMSRYFLNTAHLPVNCPLLLFVTIPSPSILWTLLTLDFFF